jgi:hypothetical protein
VTLTTSGGVEASLGAIGFGWPGTRVLDDADELVAEDQRRLSDCKAGIEPCEPSTLSELEIAHAAPAQRQRAGFNCRNGPLPCVVYSEQTPTETKEVALAEHQRNVSNCRNGWDGCDRSKLSDREAAEGEAAVQTPNMSRCKDGRDGCDYSLLSRSEAQAISSAERVRNYTACLNRRGYCDLSRLTPSEAASIPPEVR